jgi:Ca2+-binding RTX toxin-like protein
MDANTARTALAFWIALSPIIASLVAKGDSVTATSVITGTPGPDNLMGTPGDDTIQGLGGADVMTGLTGNDTYIVDNVNDEVVEEPDEGTDTVRARPPYFLAPNVENLVLTGSGNGYANGNVLNNRITGNSGVNFIFGGLGNDTLRGSGGHDWFWFTSELDGNSNVDRLPDFNVAEDRIILNPAVFWGLPFSHREPTGLPGSMFHLGASATTASHRILYDPTTGNLRFDGDGTGPSAAVRFAILPKGLGLTPGRFTIWIFN